MNAVHNSIYRASGGRLGAKVAGVDVCLLTTTGRRSGSAGSRGRCTDRAIPLVILEEATPH